MVLDVGGREWGDWSGIDWRHLQEEDGVGSYIQISGVAQITPHVPYTLTWYDKMITDVGFGAVRLNCYVDDQGTFCDEPYIEVPMSSVKLSDDWVQNTYVIRPFGFSSSVNELVFPSGTNYVKVVVVMPAISGTSSDRRVAAFDLSEGADFPGYSPANHDAVWVTGEGINNGSISVGSPISRTAFDHIGTRLWKSEDATKTPPNNFLYWDDNDAIDGERYIYAIDAFDIAGNRSPLSDLQEIVAGDVYPPAQVSDLYGEGGPNSVVLSWTCPSDDDYYNVNIYNNADLAPSHLVKTEVGAPGTRDQANIVGLIAGQEYTFWVTAVDRYRNENTTNVPSVSATPITVGQELLQTMIIGDEYVGEETVDFYVYAFAELENTPAAWIRLVDHERVYADNLALLSSSGGMWIYSGQFTVLAGFSDGPALLTASGVTLDGTNARSVGEQFFVDLTDPTVAASAEGYNYYATHKFYGGMFATLSVTGYDSGTYASGVKRYAVWNSTSSSVKRWTEYNPTGINTAVVDLPLEGSNTLYVQAEDYAGNLSSPTSVAVVRDTLAPVVTLKTNTQWINSSSITISFSATDDTSFSQYVSGLKYVWYRYKFGESGTFTSWASTQDGQTDPSVQINNITNTLYLEYRAEDRAGNRGLVFSTIINVDNQAPQILSSIWKTAMCVPVAGGFHLEWDPARITDPAPSSGIDYVNIYRTTVATYTNPVSVVSIKYSTATGGFTDISANADGSKLEYGKTYYWWMTATDKAGNTSAVSESVSGTIGYDVSGIYRNFINNGSFERLDSNGYPIGWTLTGTPSVVTTGVGHGGKSMSLTSLAYITMQNVKLLTIDANKRWIFSCLSRRGASGTPNLVVTFTFYDVNLSVVQTSPITKTLTSSYVKQTITLGGASPNVTIPANAVSVDIKLAGDHTTNSILVDAVQLEQGATSSSATATEYVESFVVSGDIIQGVRIRGEQIEAGTIAARHLLIGIHGGNLIQDPSFEIIGRNQTSTLHWTPVSAVYFTNSVAAHGGYSARFLFSGGYIKSTNAIKVNTTESYCFSAYLRSESAPSIAYAALSLECLDSSYAVLGTITANHNITQSSWTRVYSIFGAGGTALLANTEYVKPIILRYPTGVGLGLDAVQFEVGQYPSNFSEGGTTEIVGGQIKTGIIKSNDESTYFDLDNAIIHNEDATGNYSELTAGSLLFYNATAGQLVNYANQVQYVSAESLNCGSLNTFSSLGLLDYPVNAPPPIVMLIPARIQTYVSGSASSNYMGFGVTSVSNTGFQPNAYIYSGSESYTQRTSASSPTPDFTMTLAADSTSYATSDAKDENSLTNITKVAVRIRGRSAEYEYPVLLKFRVRVCTGSTWNAANIVASTDCELSAPVGGAYAYTSAVIDGLPAGTYSVKVDWYSSESKWMSQPSGVSSEVTYINYYAGSVTSLTGYGIVGAIIIGRTL